MARHTRRSVRLMVTSAVSVVAIAMTSCSGSSGGSGTSTGDNGGPAKVGDVLTVANQQGPNNLNPGRETQTSFYLDLYTSLAYQPLIAIDANKKLVPSLATSWKFLDKTNTTFEIDLRSDAKFSDGTPVTSQAVVAYFKFNMDNAASSKFWLGGATFDTPSATKIVIHLPSDHPQPELPYALAESFSPLTYIAGPKVLESADLQAVETDGAGPYMIDPTATVTNSTYVYVPNPYYYDKKAVHWKKVVIKVMPSDTSRLAALQTGQVQVAIGSNRQVSAAKAAGLQVVSGPEGNFAILFGDLNGKSVPQLANLKVRQAMAYAIDWKGIANGIFGDDATLTRQIVTKGMAGYDPDLEKAYSYDPTKAKQLLAEAGYPDGFDAGTLLVAPPVGMSDLAQALTEQWSKIGIRSKPLKLAVSQWLNQVRTKPQPLMQFQIALVPLVAELNNIFGGKPFTKGTDYSALNALVSAAQRLPAGTDESAAAWKKVTHYISDNVLLIGGLMPNFTWFAKSDIGGVSFNPPAVFSIRDWYQK